PDRRDHDRSRPHHACAPSRRPRSHRRRKLNGSAPVPTRLPARSFEDKFLPLSCSPSRIRDIVPTADKAAVRNWRWFLNGGSPFLGDLHPLVTQIKSK